MKAIRILTVTLGLAACLALPVLTAKDATSGSRPNIVMIFVDDMGYGDPGCYGGNLVPTPHIDSLAREGVRFTDGYVTAPLCAPSRSGLLTGAYQQRFGMQWNPDLGEGRFAVPESHKLMSQALAEAGYTTGMVGKWNMPGKASDYFDEVLDEMNFVGNYFPEADGRYAGVDGVPAPPYADWHHVWGPDRPGDEYLTDRLTRHAADFVRRHRDEPFFLYLSYNAPHSPFQAKHEHNEQFSTINPEPLRLYAGMIAAIDEGVGQLLAALRDEGLDERTLVAFVSDNGPDWADSRYANWSDDWPNGILMGSAGPLSGNKAMFKEGGLRVPFILRWPGRINAGQVYREPVMSFDLYPTFCAAAGITVPTGTTSDGVDLIPYLDGSRRDSPHDILFWKADGMGAVRKGDWKLVVNPSEPFQQLFNLKEDIGESRDLAGKRPKMLADLAAEYEAWCAKLPPPARQKVGIFLSAEEDIAQRKKASQSAGKAKPQVKAGEPNILLILTDDLGWRDLSCYGSTFYESPNIDRLASQGMRFTDAYSAANVCSPTRAAVLTGKTPARLHLTDFLSGLEYPHAALSPPDWERWYLPHEEITVAEMLKEVGYETFYFGKWHLGGEAHFPTTQGFDHSAAESQSGWPGAYFYPWPTVKHLKGEKGDYLTDRITDEVIRSIEQPHERPFFIQLSYYTPHRPTEAKEKFIRKYEAKLTPENVQRNPVNAGMIQSLDENVGRIMQSLDDLKLADNTLLIFASDNGGVHYADRPQKTNNAPLRAGKGDVYEGAYRVPLIIRWPGNIPAGTETSEPVSSIDFFPTLQALTRQELKAEQELDGINLLPLLLKQQPLERKALYWHYPHYHNGGASPHGVIRKGSYRLIEFFDGTQAELYDIENDIGETVNLYMSMPDKAQELLNDLHQWREEVGAQMPTLNPKYDLERLHEWMFFQEPKPLSD